jgi:hypothetical protein
VPTSPLDFPNTPIVGQKWPAPPIVGQPIYTWDGVKWVTTGEQIGNSGPATQVPLADAAVGQVGTSLFFAREDHVHPIDPGNLLQNYVAIQDQKIAALANALQQMMYRIQALESA